MTVDYQTLLYGPIFELTGVEALLHRPAGDPVPLLMLDKTTGVPMSEGDRGIQTVRPVAVVRANDLVEREIEYGSLRRSRLDLNDVTWRIATYYPKPSPRGERDGEIWLILERPPANA